MRAEARGWRARAACRTEDPELFFPISYTNDAMQAQIGHAKTICGRCPTTSECLAAAFRRREEHGIFGGLTPDERRALPGWMRAEPIDEKPLIPAAHGELGQGGRPLSTALLNRIAEVDRSGRTAREVAEQVGCGERSVEKARTWLRHHHHKAVAS